VRPQARALQRVSETAEGRDIAERLASALRKH